MFLNIVIRGAFGPPIGGIPPIFKKLDKKLTGEQKIGDMAIKIGGSVGKGQRSGQLIVFAKDKKQKACYV